MSEIRTYVCEVCGKQEADNTYWFLVAEDRSGDTLQILPWDDELAGKPGICHVCCAEHVQQLAGRAMTLPPQSHLHLAPRHREPVEKPEELQAAALLGELNINRAWLGTAGDDHDSLLAILDALEVVLKDPESDTDDVVSFDA